MEFVIVTPSYNQVKFLKQTLKSVSNQKEVEVSHWIFDGGSSDGSEELLNKYSKNIYFESKKDKGQSHAINKGINKLRAWIKAEKKDPTQVIFAYLNSDDYYLPNALSMVQTSFQKNKNIKWLVGDCEIVNENGREIQKPIRVYKKIWRMLLSKSILGILNPIPQPSVFIRASEIMKIGFFNEDLEYVMDYEYWFRALTTSGKPGVISNTLAAFRIHQESKGGLRFKEQFEEQTSVAKRFVKNPLILKLQRLHNQLIIYSYKMVK